MATCQFSWCDVVDDSDPLPPGWSLVLFETRKPDRGFLEIERRRILLCPDHSVHVAQLCGLLPAPACAEPAEPGYAARG